MQVQRFSATGEPLPRRRGGCLLRSIILLLVLLVILIGAWFLAIRPYVHGIAQSEIDQSLNTSVQQMPDQVAGVPLSLLPPISIPVKEAAINNLIVLNSAPSDPIQHMQAHITPAGIRVDFDVYGFPCGITGIPQAQNGRLVMTNVNVEGIAALIMSPDEMTTTINNHLADAQNKLGHPITSVQLKDQEMDLQLGPAGNLPSLPGFP